MQDDYSRKLEDQKGLFKQLGIKLDALSIHEKEFDVKCAVTTRRTWIVSLTNHRRL
ncbi:hypothetical protein HMSSN036_77240 [Paenibacillus macerans]|nr:hypothetical protein HMSSN036_77240 [Paenibacillus macerans]